MLTPLQQRLLEIVNRLPEADGFALAGGAALIMRGTVDRYTNDLDFFIGHGDIETDTIATMVAAVERALSEAGIGWRREAVSGTFARLTVETEQEECRIDLAVDVRVRPGDHDAGVALLSLEELAADKVLALFGRAAHGTIRTSPRCEGTSAGRPYSNSRARRRRFRRRAFSWRRSRPSIDSPPRTSLPPPPATRGFGPRSLRCPGRFANDERGPRPP